MVILAGLVSGRRSPLGIPADRWPALIELALDHGLGPMLWWVIGNSGIDPGSDPAWMPLVQSIREATIHSLLLERARRQIADVLAAAGLPVVWLKGAALAHTVYPQPTLRPMLDLDLLVPFAPRLAALARLESLGFRRWGAYSFDAAPALLHHFTYHYSLRGGPSDRVAVELHFHLLDKIRAKPLLSPAQLRWFWTQTRPVTDDRLSFLALKPEAHLLYLCAHTLLQHGEADLRLLRYFDLHQLITHAGLETRLSGDRGAAPSQFVMAAASPLDWRLVVDRAVALGWADAVARALSSAVAWFDTAVPPWVLPELRERCPPGEDASVVAERQASANRWDELRAALATMSAGDRLRALRALAFPSAAHLRHRYSVAPNVPAWPRYPWLWLDQGREIVDWLRRSRRTAF
ncbi:MAG: nucleotidyltransferase domain-containing protein [Chloroflexota bacterium]